MPQRVPSNESEMQREPIVRVGEISLGELRDAAKTLTNGVAMQEEIARDRVHTAVQANERLERRDEIGVPLLILGQRAERLLGLRLDVAFGLTKHEPIRTEILEPGRLSLAPVAAFERDGLLRLEQREVRSRRSALRSAHRRGELRIVRLVRDDLAQPLPFAARIDVLVDLIDRR